MIAIESVGGGADSLHADEGRTRATAAAADAALKALACIARLHHVAADPAQLAHRLALDSAAAVDTATLLLAARHLGLKARLSRSTPERLPLAPLPALALMRDGSVVVLAQCQAQRVLLQRFDDAPGGAQGPAIESVDGFAAAWSGQLILIASRASLAGELAKFDFSWFIPAWSGTAG